MKLTSLQHHGYSFVVSVALAFGVGFLDHSWHSGCGALFIALGVLTIVIWLCRAVVSADADE